MPDNDSPAVSRSLLIARFRGIAALAAIFVVIAFVIPRPPAVTDNGWRLFALFAATVAGLILQPLPQGALVLAAVVLSPIVAGLSVAQALSGFSDSTVWLVIAAFLISRALINTGLARRIALLFVRMFGRSSVGVCYALAGSDILLATVIPSNGARSGGVVLPIVRSIAELYGSRPGTTAPLIGSFLMAAVYQSICVSAAMFYTGQASNPLAAKIASGTGYVVTWTKWFIAGIVPGLVSVAVIPHIVMWLNPAQIRRTPEAAQFAASELELMGKPKAPEWITAAVFAGVSLLWITSPIHQLDIAITALIGGVALLVTGVLSWEDVKAERSAWDLFIWYGGLVMLGKALGEAKVPAEFARMVGGAFAGLGWPMLLGIALAIYFYAHYAFASITAHILAMYPPFLALLLAQGAPVGLVIFSFACFANLAAGLTHYGTTPSPMFFAHDYVPLGLWWRIGLIVSFVNLLIWSTIGFAWWRLVGIW